MAAKGHGRKFSPQSKRASLAAPGPPQGSAGAWPPQLGWQNLGVGRQEECQGPGWAAWQPPTSSEHPPASPKISRNILTPPSTHLTPPAFCSPLSTHPKLLSRHSRGQAKLGAGEEQAEVFPQCPQSSEEGALGAQLLPGAASQVFSKGAAVIFSFISRPLHKGQALSRSCLKTTAEFTGAR